MPISHKRRIERFKFYLGTHMTSFMHRTDVPLFVSRRVMPTRKCPTSFTTWALDSGGFTELSMYGQWTTSPGMYAAQVRYLHDNTDGMEWAAVQDWMCEPFILAKTGLSVLEHQRRTIQSYHRLKELQPRMPWVPVIQGYHPSEYIDHVRQYERAGVDLTSLPTVGVGSVCRRQSSDVDEAVSIIRELYTEGIRLHAFGFKITGLARCASMLASADSMAWSMDARRRAEKLVTCEHKAKNCANCLAYALQWRQKVLQRLG